MKESDHLNPSKIDDEIHLIELLRLMVRRVGHIGLFVFVTNFWYSLQSYQKKQFA